MGCTQSAIENAEALSRCRDRRQLMKEALSARHALAAAHSAYTAALKNSGAALSDFAASQSPSAAESPSSSAANPAANPPIDETLPPPPPPLPPPPLQRSATMPDLPPAPRKPPIAQILEEDEDPPILESKGLESTWDYFFGMGGDDNPIPIPSGPQLGGDKIEDDKVKKTADLEEKDDNVKKAADLEEIAVGSEAPVVISEKPPPGKKKQKQRVGVSLLKVLNELDDHFLMAHQSGTEVARMLEAARMHYHSNFAHNQGHIDHSARVMRVITWNKSLKGIPNADDGKDDYHSAEWETHATVLDKMLAWEKKLYEDVKASGLMKIEYQRKVALLNKQRKNGVNPEVLERTKSAVSHLHTRFIVDMQSMDSTVSEISRLRDVRLYSKLLDLVDGMSKMWRTMYTHHVTQLKIATNLRALDISLAPYETTTEQHHDRTVQLWEVLREWHSQFQKLMANQKAYIRALNGWLKLNVIPIERSSREKATMPPIHSLLHAWHDQLEKLPDELASGAIYSFSEVVRTIMAHQEDELKQKEKCKEIRKECMRKARAFEDWYQKHLQRKAASSSEESNPDDPVAERKFVVEALKSRLESETETYRNLSKQVREKSVGSLRTHLPELFRAMSDFARVSAGMYKELRSSISQSRHPEDQ